MGTGQRSAQARWPWIAFVIVGGATESSVACNTCNANRRAVSVLMGGDGWRVPVVRGQGHYNCALIIFHTQLSFLPGPRFPT